MGIPDDMMARLTKAHDSDPRVIAAKEKVKANQAITTEALRRMDELGTKKITNPNYQRRYEWLLVNEPGKAQAYWDTWARLPRMPDKPMSPKAIERELALKALDKVIRNKEVIKRRI